MSESEENPVVVDLPQPTSVASSVESAFVVTSVPSEPNGSSRTVEVIENSDGASTPVVADSQSAEAPFPEEISINDLQACSPGELQALADNVGWRTNASRSKHQLIYDLLVWMGQHKTRIKMEGIIEIGPENFGMIRYPRYSFAPLPEDVFVPLFLVRKFQLQPGQKIIGYAKAPREKEKYLAIDRISELEGIRIEDWQAPVPFDKLTATFPSRRVILETPKDASVSARVVDIIAPLGKGQRALICASPRSGKTMLLKEIAKSITVNHPEICLIVLLLDERPEEVTDFEETVQKCEIYSSTFDESPKRHTQVAELVAERAKRLVEQRKDVVILLDSITRLARGYNALQGGKGRTMSGGVESKALMKPKKFFGAARNLEEGGSLTIVATALIETESRMDEVIFEEFKGTGNMEVTLDREISERRIFPAIHVLKSGTRRDDLLYHPEEFRRISVVRKQMAAVPAFEAIELLIRNIHRTGNNAELLLKGLRS
ncbi:MAG: transcription termination factor Rho [Fimbriimonadaceae bacterium]